MSSNECPECGTPKHPLIACPECGFTHRLTAQSARSDTIDSSPEVAWQPPTIADQTKARSAPVIRHKRRRLTAVAGSSIPRCAVCDSPAVPGEALCAQHSEDVGLVD